MHDPINVQSFGVYSLVSLLVINHSWAHRPICLFLPISFVSSVARFVFIVSRIAVGRFGLAICESCKYFPG